ncbi:class I SAM-dependent methyltransferase [Streptoverticillium reticulum]|uniref:class I SAM-dependent methyltransferase n=1 Tax=Streptoverticillium reticulum TaxID=1433415 RepID=UPI0039BFD254
MTDAPVRHNAAVTNRSLLSGSAYKSGQDLSARQSLYKWQSPRYDLPGLVTEQLREIRGTVVDVGCGNGKFINRLRQDRPDLRLLGLDISAGILGEVPGPVAVADAARLPLRDAGTNAVLALHMLYHVEDIPAAVAELGRVLAEGGTVVASTNSDHDKSELDDLWQRASGDVLGRLGRDRGPSRISLSARFSLEKAPSVLGAAFSAVRVVELPGTIAVTDPAPVVAHMASYRAWADQYEVPFDETIQRAERIVSQQIEEQGRFEITCLGGLLICRR